MITALAVHTREVIANTIIPKNAENLFKFLKSLDRKYRNKKLHIIADNLSIHKQKDVKEWLNPDYALGLVMRLHIAIKKRAHGIFFFEIIASL